MEYTIIDEIKYCILRKRKILTFIFIMMILLCLLSLIMESYSNRTENDFKEIQTYLEIIRKNDKHIYNPLEIEMIEKEVKGIDVSSWQEEIDWETVKTSGIDYVMIRCGFRNLISGEIVEDKFFRRNIKEANRLGIPVGVYFYSVAINENEALEEATFVLNAIKDYDVTYPIVYDFESFDKNRALGVSARKINNNAIKFLDYMRAHGYNGMLYTNLRAIESLWDLEMFIGYGIWYAQYIDIPTYYGKYDMWQYTDSGTVPGIKGGVDMNIGYVSYEVVEKRTN